MSGDFDPNLAAASSGKEGEEGKESSTCRVAMVQMRAVNDVESNFSTCSDAVKEASEAGAQMVFFPECFAFIGAHPGEAQKAAQALDGPLMQRYCTLVKTYKVWLSLGGFQERCERADEERIYNTHVIIDSNGTITTTYRKIHLFDVPSTGLVESRQALPGDTMCVCDSPCGRLGVTICYDMRFPELYQQLAFEKGAQVLLMPSAFTVKTGIAHWSTLLRCRAVETQCYVIAAAQAGQHNEDGNCRQSYGHSLAVDPWGEVVAGFDAGCEGEMGTETGVVLFEVDLGLLERTRQKMPLDKHRRYDIYGGCGGDGGPKL